MTTLTVRIPDNLNQTIELFCQKEDRSKSWLIKKALQEKLEDWIDTQIAKKGLNDYQKKPDNFISHEALLKELGIKK